MEDQLGALGLVLNCITLWNTVYLAPPSPASERPATRCATRTQPGCLLRRHLNVHGHYSFQLPELTAGRRPLRDHDGLEDETD